MSNSIELYRFVVTFTPQEFDVVKFKELLGRYSYDIKPSWNPETREENDYYVLWWFLGANSEVDENDNVTIRFGRGNSTHTWRDFRSVIWLLNRFIKRPKIHQFLVADEFDDYENVGSLRVSWPYTSWEELYEAV